MKTPRSVYFLCTPHGPPDRAGYQHQVVQLAEGLAELGIAVYSNTPYWKRDPDTDRYLLNPVEGITHRDCDVVVISHTWNAVGNPMPAGVCDANRPFVTVYLDAYDGYRTPGWEMPFRSFDYVIKTHLNHKVCGIPANMVPGAFGLTHRLLAATSGTQPWTGRRKVILSNFRCEHALRDLAKARLHPLLARWFDVDATVDDYQPPVNSADLLAWEQTGRRHEPGYYKRLAASQAVSCFGGRYHTRFLGSSRWSSWMGRRFPLDVLFQWDSWRLWEAFSAGCLVFHVDFKHEGVALPVMPENWTHYIGVDFKRLDLFSEKLANNADRFESIALNGQRWAREHYSPRAVAQRFLNMITGVKAG
jgi:hypothetical protein